MREYHYRLSVRLRSQMIVTDIDREAAAAIEAMAREEEHSQELVARLGGLLRQTVDALRGPPPPLTLWSYHDVPELALALVKERDALREELDEFRNGYKGACYACEPVGMLNSQLASEVARLREAAASTVNMVRNAPDPS